MDKEKSCGDKGHPYFTLTVGLTLAALSRSCRRYWPPAYTLWRAERRGTGIRMRRKWDPRACL